VAFQSHRFAQLLGQHESGFDWQPRARESWTMDSPLDPFTVRQIAAERSTNAILREARMAPDVIGN
jgi:hypothetical protein